MESRPAAHGELSSDEQSSASIQRWAVNLVSLSLSPAKEQSHRHTGGSKAKEALSLPLFLTERCVAFL